METSGWLALFGGMVASRIISERGYRRLSTDEKVRLMDGFSATRAYSLIPLVALMAAFWLLSTRTAVDRTLMAVGYFGALVLYVVARACLTQRKLLRLQLPANYRRTFTVAQVVSFLGIAWFFFAFISTDRF